MWVRVVVSGTGRDRGGRYGRVLNAGSPIHTHAHNRSHDMTNTQPSVLQEGPHLALRRHEDGGFARLCVFLWCVGGEREK